MKEYFTYLNELRDSGVTNMYGAGKYLCDEFGIDKHAARDILKRWMASFDEQTEEQADASLKAYQDYELIRREER